jgi:hypothetical protein
VRGAHDLRCLVTPFDESSFMKRKMIPGEWEPRPRAVVAHPQEASRLLDHQVTAVTAGPFDVWHRPGIPMWVKVSIFGAVLIAAMFLAS